MSKQPIFAPWTNKLVKLLGALIVGGLVYTVVLVALATSPKTNMPGYRPEQPVPYSHALHAGKLGLDCRYCHINVERGAHATVPATQTCMNCHTGVRTQSEKLTKIRDSYATGMPVEWVKVHDLPDFVYFNHSAHVTRGIGCTTCHGRIDRMDETGVEQKKLLTMGWCLECHRNPEKYLRPPELVTKMDYEPSLEEQLQTGKELRQKYNINPSTDCSTCHR
jgi:hypothetical protein